MSRIKDTGRKVLVMEIPSDRLILCPRLIDRSPDLTALQQHIHRTQRGQGQLVLVSGEAGIGKSRLVAEAKTDAAGRGFLVLHGACFQPDFACPCAPLRCPMNRGTPGLSSRR